MPPEQQLNENIWPALGFMPITLQLMSSCLGIILTSMDLHQSVWLLCPSRWPVLWPLTLILNFKKQEVSSGFTAKSKQYHLTLEPSLVEPISAV